MSVSRSTLSGGPATAAYNGAALHFGNDGKVDFDVDKMDLESSMFGKRIDFYRGNRRVKASGTPLEYTSLSVLFPYLSMAYGQFIMKTLGADVPLVWNAQNGDKITLTAAIISKMPGLFLGMEKPMLGDIEFTGIVGDGMNPEDANSYYTIATGQTYTPVALNVGNAKRQRYTGAWGAITGFTAIQAQAGWSIDWDLELSGVPVQGLDRDFRFLGLRAMAKCIPHGPSLAQIDTNLLMQGSGATEGSRGSGGTIGDLVITGSGVSVTLKKVAMLKAGAEFGGKPLRNGEMGFVTTVDVSTGTPSAVAVLA